MWPEVKDWPENRFIRQVPPEIEEEILGMVETSSPNEVWAEMERSKAYRKDTGTTSASAQNYFADKNAGIEDDLYLAGFRNKDRFGQTAKFDSLGDLVKVHEQLSIPTRMRVDEFIKKKSIPGVKSTWAKYDEELERLKKKLSPEEYERRMEELDRKIKLRALAYNNPKVKNETRLQGYDTNDRIQLDDDHVKFNYVKMMKDFFDRGKKPWKNTGYVYFPKFKFGL